MSVVSPDLLGEMSDRRRQLEEAAQLQAGKWERWQGLPDSELLRFILPALVVPLEQRHEGERRAFMAANYVIAGVSENIPHVFPLEQHMNRAVFCTFWAYVCAKDGVKTLFHPPVGHAAEEYQLGVGKDNDLNQPYWLLAPDQLVDLEALVRRPIDEEELGFILKDLYSMWDRPHYQLHQDYQDMRKWVSGKGEPDLKGARLAHEALVALIADKRGWREVAMSVEERMVFCGQQLLPLYCLSQVVRREALKLLQSQQEKWERSRSMIEPVGGDYYVVAHERWRQGNNSRSVHHKGMTFSLVYLPDADLAMELLERPLEPLMEFKALEALIEAKGGRLVVPFQARG